MIGKIMWKLQLAYACVTMDIKNAMLRYRIGKYRRKAKRLGLQIEELKKNTA